MSKRELNSLILKKIINLRQNVLHPTGSVDKVTYAKDKSKETVHFLFWNGSANISHFKFLDDIDSKPMNIESQLIATGSLLAEDESESNSETHWRIRGMAVDIEHQGQGLGQKIVKSMIEYAKDQKSSKMIWCNARVEALTLYQRFGFVVKSEEFVIPGSGPHRRLHLCL